MPDLGEDRQQVLLELHDRLTNSEISYQLGGSGMLVLRGISVSVYDLDLVFPANMKGRVPSALDEWWEQFATIDHPHFSSDWYAQISVNGFPVDLVGGFAIKGEGTLPFAKGGYAQVAGVPIPLAPVDQWTRIYDKHDPRKAALLRELAN